MKDCWMTLSDLETRRIAIWGLGKEGWASYDFLRRHFPRKEITLINQTLPDTLPDDPHTLFLLEQDMPAALNDLDLVIKAPGISLYRPLVQTLQQQKISITSATNIWFSLPRPEGSTTIAITGSNGKSTTSALLAHILRHMGHKTALGGNIGTPLLSLTDDADYYVIELSSYQTADLYHAPDIAVLLNLYPEHIQWHLSHAQYYADKCHLISTGVDTVILNQNDTLTRQNIKAVPPGTLWFNSPDALHARGHDIYNGSDKIGDARRLRLPGEHNRQNLCAALTICAALGLELEACFEQAVTFGGLPHRLQNLGEREGISYVNDSISTTPEATLAALNSFPGRQITLIAGGQDRQQDFTAFSEFMARHKEISLIAAYETGDRMRQHLPGKQAALVEDLAAAVALAREITPPGGVILLSPAAPSYDAFRNFEHRGDEFQTLCQIP